MPEKAELRRKLARAGHQFHDEVTRNPYLPIGEIVRNRITADEAFAEITGEHVEDRGMTLREKERFGRTAVEIVEFYENILPKKIPPPAEPPY